VIVDAYFVNPNNAHVKNEKLYAFTWHDTIVDLVENVGKAKKKIKLIYFG
jgi:hypothetical protein